MPKGTIRVPKTAEEYAKPIVDSAWDTTLGKVVGLILYKYPDGHGYFKPKDSDPLPVSGKAQAMQLFEAIWDQL